MSEVKLTGRYQRYQYFEDFFNSAKRVFSEFCIDSRPAKYLDEVYGLCITPGGRNGGRDSRRVEVFFGQRPYDREENFSTFDRSRPIIKILSERGATLEFIRDDRGRVHIYLYPASTEGAKPLEDGIVVGVVNCPRDLLNRKLVARYFKYLIAYMQCTCLDGNPSFVDRFYVGKLRLFKETYINGRRNRSRLYIFFKETSKWVLTVGLSGAVLAVVQGFLSK